LDLKSGNGPLATSTLKWNHYPFWGCLSVSQEELQNFALVSDGLNHCVVEYKASGTEWAQ
jgi:hypothetical protein